MARTKQKRKVRKLSSDTEDSYNSSSDQEIEEKSSPEKNITNSKKRSRQTTATHHSSDDENEDNHETEIIISNKVQERKDQYAAIARDRAAHFARGGGAGSNKQPELLSSTTQTNSSAPNKALQKFSYSANSSSSSRLVSESLISSKTSLLSFRTRGDDVSNIGNATNTHIDEDNDTFGNTDVYEENVSGTRRSSSTNEKPSWPGPFATAQALIAGRDAAAREREEEPDMVSTKKGLLYNSNVYIDTSTYNDIPIDDYEVHWKPSRPLPVYRSSNNNNDTSNDYDTDNILITSSNSPSIKAEIQSSTPSKLNSTNTTTTQQRQPIGIAGSSGVRLEIPSLVSLCLENLVKYIR